MSTREHADQRPMLVATFAAAFYRSDADLLFLFSLKKIAESSLHSDHACECPMTCLFKLQFSKYRIGLVESICGPYTQPNKLAGVVRSTRARVQRGQWTLYGQLHQLSV